MGKNVFFPFMQASVPEVDLWVSGQPAKSASENKYGIISVKESPTQPHIIKSAVVSM